MMNFFIRLLFVAIVCLFICAPSCELQNNVALSDPAGDPRYPVFCDGLETSCPKLAALVREYPPEKSGSHNYYIHPKLLSYLLDSISTTRKYFNKNPQLCPDVTRDQIYCAIGKTDKSGILVDAIDGNGYLYGDQYTFDWNFAWDFDPPPSWTEPFYLTVFFYD